MITEPVAVLFARRDSIYKTLPELDVWDEERDARLYTGKGPVIAHPPCRAFGRLRQFAKPLPWEKDLAYWSVDTVRANGGVLEHPATSRLWADKGLPAPGKRDASGGFTLPILQKDFGHRADKSTWLYVSGIEPRQLPGVPLVLGMATHVVQTKRGDGRPHIRKAEREETPLHLALWLVEVASMCRAI